MQWFIVYVHYSFRYNMYVHVCAHTSTEVKIVEKYNNRRRKLLDHTDQGGVSVYRRFTFIFLFIRYFSSFFQHGNSQNRSVLTHRPYSHRTTVPPSVSIWLICLKISRCAPSDSYKCILLLLNPMEFYNGNMHMHVDCDFSVRTRFTGSKQYFL